MLKNLHHELIECRSTHSVLETSCVEIVLVEVLLVEWNMTGNGLDTRL